MHYKIYRKLKGHDEKFYILDILGNPIKFSEKEQAERFIKRSHIFKSGDKGVLHFEECSFEKE